MTLDRRSFTQATLGTLVTYSLLETLFDCDAFAAEIKPVTAKWLQDVNQLGLDLKGEKIPQSEWQTQIEKLFAQVELPELLKLIDFDALTKNVKFVDNGARSLRFSFAQIEGAPSTVVYGRQVFALKKGRSVVPHGHNNMTTGFIVLKGTFHGRHYDRLEDEKDSIIIKPTIDGTFAPGTYSTITDEKDNVHWFKALDEPGFIFNIHALNVNPGSKLRTGRVYLDPNGEKLSDGRIRAKRLNHEETHKLYG